MPVENEDVSSASSTDTPATEAPASEQVQTDTAVSQEPPAKEAAPSSASDSVPASDSNPPEPTNAKSAIEFLSKGPDKSKTEDKTTPKVPATDKPAEKPAPEAKAPEEKKLSVSDDPLADYDEKDKKRLSERTTSRIRTLHSNWKQAEERFSKAAPLIQQGEAFASVVDDFKVREDLGDLGDNSDAAVAGAIKFQAALNRVASGRARANDAAVVSQFFEVFDQTREQLGMPKAAAVDAAALETAIAKARDEFDYSDLDALLANAKKAKAPAPVQQPVAQQPVPQHHEPPAPQQPQIDADTEVYNGILASTLTEAGVDPAQHVRDKLWPSVLTDLKAHFPGQDPVAVYQRLSAKAQYDMMMVAHAKVQKQVVKPVPRPSTPPTPKPVSTSGASRMGAEAPTSGVKAAIDFLSNG